MATDAKVKATLLSGFLGAGKTSLMRHVLSNREGVRCAVIVNEISELNLDADILAGTKLIESDDQLVEMANGCICCTLRGDLLDQLLELSSSGKYDCVLIESSGIAEPMQVAETFFVETEQGQLQTQCALDNCVTVVDASTFEEYMGRIDTVAAIDAKAKETEDDRDIAALFVDQLEFANVVVLNKIDLIPEANREAKLNQLTAFIRTIAPTATVIPTSGSKVPLSKILNTGNFTLDFANGSKDWMEDIKSGIKHVPETLEYGVSSMMFRSERPFHPKRLHDWITKHFVLSEMKVLGEADDAASKQEASALKEAEARKVQDEMRAEAAARKARRVEAYGNLFRGKGHIYVGSPGRNLMFGVWSQAGTMLSLTGGGLWEELPQPRGGAAAASTTKPHQLLAFVGQDLKADRLKADLEALLLTPKEEAQLKRHITDNGPCGAVFEDPFEPWAEYELADEEDGSDEDSGEWVTDSEEGEEEEEDDASESDGAPPAAKASRSERR
eukprot:CAMPEP_0174836218 /NCGR_PEP_ID=MMETSP1114-20130205/5900_1 /TAXON_ID=312471 /ORGANISM="Neobodo designis, Strain CCAP 1951/1" /LENGTH=500 /DNA_ID=CAMNT_0016070191 /DNA_START=47 /DNA_END=1549 /DNA_ORIENTATION=+